MVKLKLRILFKPLSFGITPVNIKNKFRWIKTGGSTGLFGRFSNFSGNMHHQFMIGDIFASEELFFPKSIVY